MLRWSNEKDRSVITECNQVPEMQRTRSSSSAVSETSLTPDPLGRRPDVHGALCNPGLADLTRPGGELAAYWLAVAYGNCRLEGIAPEPKDDGTLVAAAAREMERQARDLTADADSLPLQHDACHEPPIFERLVCGILHRRVELWAASVALDEAHDAALAEVDPKILSLAPEFNEVLPWWLDGRLESQRQEHCVTEP